MNRLAVAAPTWVLCFSVVGASTGCATFLSNFTERPENVKIEVPAPLQGPMPVVMLDSRPEVLSGEIKPSYVGRRWSLGGVPSSEHTYDNAPAMNHLQLEVTQSMPHAYGELRFREVRHSKDTREARAAATPRQPDEMYGLLFVVNDWHTEFNSGNDDLRHDVVFELIGRDGSTLATSRSTADEPLERNNAIFAAMLSRLLNAPSVNQALSGEQLPPPPPAASTVPAQPAPPAAAGAKAKCTVDQVLKMKEMKFSDAQIKAACD